MSVIIPGCTGLFSILRETFCHEDKYRDCICLFSTLHGFLNDFQWLAQDLVSQPTRITELIPDREPATKGVCDAVAVAAAAGVGDIHCVPTDIAEIPILWRQPFPDWIRTQLSSFKNLTGKIIYSDLELAGSITQNDILAHAFDVVEKTIHNSYDNIATLFWQRKGATTMVGPAAFLLCLQALRQCFFCYVPLCDYIPGPINVMAEFLSRR